MTTSAGLPAVRESLHLALLADPAGSSAVTELAEAAVEHYALNYSKHPPGTSSLPNYAPHAACSPKR
ncbi:hypothetical protein [Streptomyces sp. NPDC001657]|uniref:hypothetical protein n=1 Tax=Streptomyces sp. NPDC001657 TaxID=3154522 RepID=UPI003316528B